MKANQCILRRVKYRARLFSSNSPQISNEFMCSAQQCFCYEDCAAAD